MANPDWYPDPANRYQYRYFDGALWTNHVSTNGEASIDPVPVGQPADWQWTFCKTCQAICMFDDDHCWKCVSSFPENRVFGTPPQPAFGAPLVSQFESAQNAMTSAFEHAERALNQNRAKDALRGFDEALWHRHFAEQLMMQLPKNGTSAGFGVSLLTMGLGPTDLIVGPLVRSFVNKRTQNKREKAVANDRLIIQAHGLLALSNLPEFLDRTGGEHEVLVRFALAYQAPGNLDRANHSMPNEQLQFFIRNQVSRMQTEFPEINGLLGDYAVYFQWLDLGRLLASMGYPIGNLLTGERPREERSSSNYGNASSASQAREEALRELGLDSEASQDDVKQAYRTLSKKFHPDAHATASPEILELAEEKMRKINNAYDFLTSQAN
jgi:hypothetical protein